MKIFDKVKTILWDNTDEEDYDYEEEVKSQPAKPVVKKEIKKEEKKESKVEETEQKEMINERDLFKTDSSFKFPVVFTEEDFAKTIPPEKQVNTIRQSEYNNKEEKEVKKNTEIQNERKTFRVSPAISPIYGVLDKNYKSEDIKSKQEPVVRNNEKEVNFENIRKKAYGTLADDIEKTMIIEKGIKKEIVENEVKLKENKNVTIEEAMENYKGLGITYNKDNNTEDDIVKIKKDKKAILEDTIEQDLFNLIDSMYDKEEKEGEDIDGTSK